MSARSGGRIVKRGWKVGGLFLLGGMRGVCMGTMCFWNEWTERQPGWGPLGVFSDYNDACKFACAGSIGAHTNGSESVSACFYTESEDTRMWNSAGGSRQIFPTGTVLADDVFVFKPIGEIPEHFWW